MNEIVDRKYDLPMVALRGLTVLPDMIIHFDLSREMSIKAVEQALERKTGARGLRSIMEKIMMNVMYEIPSDDTIESCVITKEAVEGTSQPFVVHREALLAEREKKAR